MGAGDFIIVRMFGKLHSYRRQQGLPAQARVWIPAAGVAAQKLAEQLELPLHDIEAVFCNHIVYDLDHILRPGDQVAFVSTGVPGPHRFLLGIHAAGKSNPADK